jgi:CHASE1-domain containing sensor protein
VQRYWRGQGLPTLTLRPDPMVADHAFVIFSRPLDGRPGTLGVDVAGSPHLRQVLEHAWEHQDVAVSDSYVLLKDGALPPSQRQLSFTMAAPVTTADDPSGDAPPAGRLRGWLVMGLRGQDLLRGTLQDAAQGQANVTLTTRASAPAVGAPARRSGHGELVVAERITGAAHEAGRSGRRPSR